MFTRISSAVLAALLPAATALAQFAGGVNIDFNVTAGAGAGQPTILLGGAAGQAGYWNPLNPPFAAATTFPVRNLANSAGAVNLIVESAASTGSFSFNNALTTGDNELLLDDIHDTGNSDAVYSIGTFAGGVYDVYVYAIAPDSEFNRMEISLFSSANAAFSAPVTVGGAVPAGGVFMQGVTHSVQRIALARSERVLIHAHPTVGAGSVNGIQVKPVAGVTRLYVKSDAPAGGQNGMSWATALTDLQRAISVANDTPSVTEIWVAGGTHRPDGLMFGLNDRTAVFQPRAGLSIIGSFAGTEAVLADRTNLAAHPTILSGNLGAPGVTTDNAYHLIYGPASGTLTLDGLILADAHRDVDEPAPGGDTDGSALHVGSGAAVIRNCTLRDCAGFDAALVIGAGGSASITDTVFERNTSARTTALWVSGAGAAATVERCIFRDHTMVGSFLGGLIECDEGATLTLANSLVHDNNRRSPTAGMYMLGVVGGAARVYNCTFAHNTGGGMYISTGFTVHLPSAIIRSCILWGNRRLIDPGATIEDQQFHVSAAVAVTAVGLSDSNVEGWTETRWTGQDNNDLDPRFIDIFGPDGYRGSDDDNYRLASRSPARDSAWHGGTPAEHLTLDLLKNPRVVDDPYFPNTGYSSHTTPLDRGCYEAQAPSAVCPGDVGRQGGIEGPDGLRDNNDFVVYITWFFAPDPRADIGRQGGVAPGDGLFDNNDFVVFIDMFFSACP